MRKYAKKVIAFRKRYCTIIKSKRNLTIKKNETEKP